MLAAGPAGGTAGPDPRFAPGLCVLVADSRLWRLPRLLVGCAVALLGCVTAQALLPAFPVPPVLEQLYEERTPPATGPVLEAG